MRILNLKYQWKVFLHSVRLAYSLVTASLFSVALWSNGLIAAECLNYQTITLNTQSEVDSFQTVYGNGGICDTIKWSLDIEGPDITNLDGLSAIKLVGRNLSISNNGELLSISGLSNLVEVKRILNINENAKLLNLEGLSALTTTSSLSLYGNGSLENINALSSLASVQQNLMIGLNALLTDLNGLSNLSSVGGLLDIVGNPTLTNIDGLSSLNNASSVQIRGNSALTDIDGLASLEVVESLRISNSSLTDLYGLSSLTGLKGLTILNNPFLANINGLAGVSGNTPFGLRIDNNPSLSSLDGLNGVTGTGNLVIMRNESMASLSGLTGLTYIQRLIITGNTNLVSIEALSGITGSLGTGLQIIGNPLLTNIDALSKITSAGTNLTILGNDSLENVNGLISITNLRGDLDIRNNNALTQLDGLASLISVGDAVLSSGGNVSISDNPLLRRCIGLIPLLDQIDDGEVGPGPGFGNVPDVEVSISIRRNHEDCNSAQIILDAETSAELSVSKTYSNDNPTPVGISLDCDLPTTLISVLDAQASPDSDAVFEVRRFVPGFYSSCSASEEQVPVGYTADDADCQKVQLTDRGSHYCNITNQQVAVRVEINKSYIDPATGGDPEVLVTLDCPSGVISPGDTIITDDGTATFEVVDFNFEGVTCVASERIETGYIQIDASGCDNLQVVYGTTPSCVFLNAIDSEIIFADGLEE